MLSKSEVAPKVSASFFSGRQYKSNNIVFYQSGYADIPQIPDSLKASLGIP